METSPHDLRPDKEYFMKPQARLQIYPPAGPREVGYVIGDRAGLRQLARALKNAADSPVGIESITLYSADGHAYDMLIDCDVTEQEWQTVGPQYSKVSPKIQSITDFQEIRKEILQKQAG